MLEVYDLELGALRSWSYGIRIRSLGLMYPKTEARIYPKP